MKNLLFVFICSFIYLFTFPVTAQVYPVQSGVFIKPPYSVYLSDYAALDNDKISANLLLNYSTGQTVDVKLRITIEGPSCVLRTLPTYIPPAPITLQGGEVYICTALELAPYFEVQNLQIDCQDAGQKNQILRDKKLPEGIYRISIEALEYYRNVLVSSKGGAMAWMLQPDPPMLTLPQDKQVLTASDDQQIIFSWLPRHTASPNQVQQVQYVFSLYELENNIDPQVAINQRALFEADLFVTSAKYDLSCPPLVPGKSYAWRVRAESAQGQNLFKNNGYSEVRTFTWGSVCETPQNPRSSTVSTTQQKIEFESAAQHTAFLIQYREQGQSVWYDKQVKTITSPIQVVLNALKPAKIFEYQIKGLCGNLSSNFTDIYTFRSSTDDANENCAGSEGAVAISNIIPYDGAIEKGSTITVGGYNALLTSIEKNADGSYSGTCDVFVSNFNFTVKSEFLDIKINTNLEVYEGVVHAIYDPKSGTVVDADGVRDDAKALGGLTIEVWDELVGLVQDIKDLAVKMDQSEDPLLIPILDELGALEKLTPEAKENLQLLHEGLSDLEKATTPSEREAAITKYEYAKQELKEEMGLPKKEPISEELLVFKPVAGEELFFDQPAHISMRHKYDFYAVSKEKMILFPWKSMAVNVPAQVEYEFKGTLPTGAILKFKLDNAEITAFENKIQIPAQTSEGDNQRLQAYITITANGKTEEKLVGSLSIAVYEPKAMKVRLVAVNDAGIISELTNKQAEILTYLNSAYKPANASWSIEVEREVLQISLSSNDKFDAIEYDLIRNYSSGMKTVIQTWQNSPQATNNEDNELILFFLKGQSTPLQGFMPLGYKHGFLFLDKITGTNEPAHTIAHELGHGAFKLRHPFDEFKTPQGSTNTLMDYAVVPTGGILSLKQNALFKYQWDDVHIMNVAILTWMQEMGDGAIINYIEIDEPKGIDCKGRIIGDFHATDNNKFLVPCLSKSNPYVIVGFNIYDRTTKAKEKYISCDDFESDLISIDVSKGSGRVPVYLLTNDNCTYQKLDIDWTYKEGIDISSEIAKKTEGGSWKVRAFLYNADISCFLDFIKTHDASQECLNADNINKDFESLSAFFGGKGDDEKLVNLINSICKSALKKCNFDQLSELYERFGNSEEIKNYKEIAILRLMSCINSSDYSKFYKLLESIDNKLIINLISKISDSAFPWGDDNYTSFIGGLIQMFKVNPDGYMDRIGAEGSEQLAGQVINLNPKPFVSDIEVSIFGGLIPLNEFRYTGVYDNKTGKIKIYKEERVLVSTPIQSADYSNSLSTQTSLPVWARSGDAIADLSPLTPVIISATDNLPLIETALGEPLVDANEDVFIVPAIFFKYKGDKEFNHAAGQAAMITLDVITIYASGGTLLATKVLWVKRVWALTEVAGAIGNIVINSGVDVSPKFQTAIDIYNGTMGIIGLYHAGNGVYKLAKTLPEATRKLLAENKNIRAIIMSKYLDWQVAVNNVGDISDAERQIISEQEKVWEILGVGKVAEGANLFLYNRLRAFLSDGKIKAYLNNQQLLDFENVLKTANNDVLKVMDEFNYADEFAEMVRGYKDNPTAFTNAIKNLDDFNGTHGWLKFWKLTPRMETSLNTIANLKNGGKLADVGNATDIQLASIHAYTANGDFINQPFRYQPTWFGEYNTRAIKHINEGLEELRKVDGRLFKGKVYSGKTFSKADFENKFVGKINSQHSYNGYMSTSKLESVAEGFIDLTKQWASGNGEKVAVIQRVVSKNGVYIDDISDWGKNLGKTNHPTANIKLQVQEEVLLNSQKLMQTSEPIPVMENGIQKIIDGMEVYYIDFIEVL